MLSNMIYIHSSKSSSSILFYKRCSFFSLHKEPNTFNQTVLNIYCILTDFKVTKRAVDTSEAPPNKKPKSVTNL